MIEEDARAACDVTRREQATGELENRSSSRNDAGFFQWVENFLLIPDDPWTFLGDATSDDVQLELAVDRLLAEVSRRAASRRVVILDRYFELRRSERF